MATSWLAVPRAPTCRLYFTRTDVKSASVLSLYPASKILTALDSGVEDFLEVA